jgi:hypothetical protein
MASVIISGDTSGSVTLSAPTVAGSSTQTLVAATGTLAPLVHGTAVASTSGTVIDFTGIPSWVKRITVMFSGVSTTGTSPILIQIGTGGVPTTTGYSSSGTAIQATGAGAASATIGFQSGNTDGASTWFRSGSAVLSTLGSNIWQSTILLGIPSVIRSEHGGGSITLAGTLDMVRVTTRTGTDTFDAGTINIMYE